VRPLTCGWTVYGTIRLPMQPCNHSYSLPYSNKEYKLASMTAGFPLRITDSVLHLDATMITCTVRSRLVTEQDRTRPIYSVLSVFGTNRSSWPCVSARHRHLAPGCRLMRIGSIYWLHATPMSIG